MVKLYSLCTHVSRKICVVALVMSVATTLMAQSDDHIAEGLASVAAIAGETKTAMSPQDSVTVPMLASEIPVWRQKFYLGYNFDIYFHHDTRSNRKENGWSFALELETGWRLKERLYLGMRYGGRYQDMYTTYTYELTDGSKKSEDIRIMQGSWSVTPYVRYRLKTLFNNKVGIWLETHLYAGMEFPRVTDGLVSGTDYEGLRHSITYGAQLSPVITYQFNRKSTFQIFFSILSVGYSGTTFCYANPITGEKYNEYTNDVIIFSGKLRNLIANQFTPGLYGFKIGVQKSFY